MSNIKATITSEGKSIQFNIWRGMPQRPKVVIDIFRRLGGNRQRIQKLGYQSNVTTSQAEYWSTDSEASKNHINDMLSLIGLRVTLTYYGEVFENVLILDVTYNKKNEGNSDIDNIVYYNITYMVDGEEDQ